MNKNIIVVGGGPAGMMAAISAALTSKENNKDNKIILLEKNEKLGKKLFITGKGRCNVTNTCDTVDFFDNVLRNPKFLFSAVYGFDNFRVMSFFEDNGVKLKTERGDRVFPLSDHSSDIIRALDKMLKKLSVEVRLNTQVLELVSKDNKISGAKVKSDNKTEVITADSVILATGGISYPQTGSTGDGITFAKKLNHKIMDCYPALVPIECNENYCKSLQGLSLKNVKATFFDDKRIYYEGFGEMLFTHFGVSGPLILSGSSYIGPKINNLKLEIDLKPALSEDTLDKRILRDFDEAKNKNFDNALAGLFPSKLIPVIIELSKIDPHKKVNLITKEERLKLLNVTKHFPLSVKGFRGLNEAIITRGGVSTKDIDPSSMKSKITEGLYFCGEMIDVDALTGGFNLQIAWSTGYLAGISSVEDM